MPKFVHLHTHSHYSLLDGLAKIDDLVKKAKALGMDALALTDHGNLYGAIEFYKTASKAGIKPILGIEAYIAPRSRFDKVPRVDDRYFHLILLCKNEIGWKNLIQLVTKSHLEGFYYKPRMDKELLKKHHEGLIALSACLSGEISRALLAGNYEDAKRAAFEYREIFGAENFYIEISSHPGIKETIKVREGLIRLSRETGIPLVATQDIHYLNSEDAQFHDILLAVQTGNRLSDDDRLTMREDDFSMRSPEEMEKLFSEFPEAVENTVKISNACNFKIELGKIQLPKFQTENSFTLLKQLLSERLSKRYSQITSEIKQRLDYELGVIEKMGFADYFLIVQDFVNWAKNRGIVVGPGRGSAAGSIVSYVLGITNIDPLKYNLLFERFLNPDRIQMPDIDIDFTDRRRDEVLAYLREKYGENRVAQIITFGTMAARAAIRDVGRATGLSYGFCDQVAKLIPFALHDSEGNRIQASLENALEQVSELKEMCSTNPDAKRLVDAAMHLEGVARHASVHACGIVIANDDLANSVPLQRSPQDETATITQFEMHTVEDLGLLKIDLLGLANLTTIEDTLRLVYEKTGERIDIDKITLDDKKTFELLQRTDNTGVFQFECLSGDTLVSNTTLKKLYEKRDKNKLESVYVDEGKVHRNKVLNVIKSGVKDVYALIAENDRYIKATKDHNFLTDNGWKKLSDLKPGDKIMTKNKARHLLYNVCEACERQINGQKEGKSRFCYECSARFYSNPSKPISRAHMKSARVKFFENGGGVWNKGLTVQNNEVWRKTAKKISAALTGVSLEARYGKEKAEQIKRRFSQRFSGSGNPMFGKPSPHRKGGVRNDLQHYVRSNWEADFARILNLYDIEYEYEPKTFTLRRPQGGVVHYTPDFYVKSTNTFYEIKGWLHDLDQQKIDLFQEQYPQYNFVLINKTKFAELSLRYKNLVRWECPRIPERGFSFLKVKEIKYAGKEETYDIAMEAPGNNFVANGFVIHNSSGMRRYMKEIKPSELEDLIALVALFRPGPMDLIPSYIRRKHGQEKISYLHPKLEPILKTTYGIGVYQEQMMQIARDLAGYTLAEADTLRKAIGKKIKSLLDEQQEKIVSGMIKNGITPQTAHVIWDLFPPFARYGFNRSHAACYALIGYQTAYLKAHYPVEFMTSLLNADSGDIDRIAFLVAEARKSGIAILPPDINKSYINFQPEGQNIRFGLLAIKNVGSNIVSSIIEERQRGGPFKNLEDLLMRVQHKDLNKKSLESLIKCGALDSLGIERNQALVNIDEILEFVSRIKKERQNSQFNLFGGAQLAGMLRLKPVPPVSKYEQLAWERELLGLYISDHPLSQFEGKIKQANVSSINQLINGNKTEVRTRIAGIISQVKKTMTKLGQPMLFATVEDFDNALEVLVFSDAIAKNPSLWQANTPVLINGRLSWRNDEPKFICDNAQLL